MKMSVVIALVLPVLATAVIKPKKKELKHHAWMTATVEGDAQNVEANPSKEIHPGSNTFRPQFEILNSDYEVGHSKTVEVYWQRPNTANVTGIFFGATGCFHQAGDFFEEVQEDGWVFPGCKKSKMTRCQGLPENVYSFKYARERGYLVLTINAQGPNSCWNGKYDPARLDTAVKYVIKREGLPEDIPMFGTGASQGGVFLFDAQAAQLNKTILPNLKCIAPQVAAPKHAKDQKDPNFHLPTMFIWMVKDYNLTNPVRQAIDKYKKRHIPYAERTPHPWKIDELMKARGYSNLTAETMKEVLMKTKGPFGHRPMAKNGHLIDHPGFEWWTRGAHHVLGNTDSLRKDHSKFHHLMQAAFAEHEYTAEYTDHIIDFCEGHEDKNRPLRFGREPIISGPSAHALRCSPNCPPPGASDAEGLIQLKATEPVAKPDAPKPNFGTQKTILTKSQQS